MVSLHLNVLWCALLLIQLLSFHFFFTEKSLTISFGGNGKALLIFTGEKYCTRLHPQNGFGSVGVLARLINCIWYYISPALISRFPFYTFSAEILRP